MHRFVIDDVGALSFLFGPVHRYVGILKDLLCSFSVFRVERNADADRYIQITLSDKERFTEGAENIIG
ncbi:hypothetical protein D3C74_462550 [compost metagenome]